MHSFRDAIIRRLFPKHPHYGMLAIACVCFILFFTLSALVHTGTMIDLDNALAPIFLSFTDVIPKTIWTAITFLGNAQFIIPIVIAISILLLHKKRFLDAVFLNASVVIGGLFGYFFKQIIESDRPGTLLTWLDGHHAFPSGHTIVAFTFYLGMLFLFKDDILKKPRTYSILLHVFAYFIVITLPISRVVLGVHWFTDIVGGALFGLGWTLFIFAWYPHKRLRHILFS